MVSIYIFDMKLLYKLLKILFKNWKNHLCACDYNSDSQQQQKKKKKRICEIVDFAVPADNRVKSKESGKRDKYQNPA